MCYREFGGGFLLPLGVAVCSEVEGTQHQETFVLQPLSDLWQHWPSCTHITAVLPSESQQWGKQFINLSLSPGGARLGAPSPVQLWSELPSFSPFPFQSVFHQPHSSEVCCAVCCAVSPPQWFLPSLGLAAAG